MATTELKGQPIMPDIPDMFSFFAWDLAESEEDALGFSRFVHVPKGILENRG